MKKLISHLTAIVFLLITAVYADADSPTVVSINPAANATDVSISTVITATFDHEMDVSSIINDPSHNPNSTYFTLKDSKNNGIKGTVTYDSTTNTATFTPQSPLAYSTTYTVKLSKYIKDTDGYTLGSSYGGRSYSWDFTTGAKPSGDTTPPTITFTDPPSNATGIAVNSVISAIFSEPMDATTITAANFTVSNGVTGTVTYVATASEAIFTPSANLASGTTYTVTITTGVKDLASNAMAVTKTWSFTTTNTDTTPPTVSSTSPGSGVTGVAVSSVITVMFSEPMDASTITSANVTLKIGGTAVTGTVTYDAATYTATFTPDAPLSNSTTYTTSVSTGVKDLAGNAMAAAKTWTFTTVAVGAQAPLTDYCNVPPFVTSGANSLQPNVLLIVDNSGSMHEFAYKTAGSGSGSYDTSYDPSKNYYGYFDSGKMYKYTTTSGGYFEIDTTKTLDTTNFWSGNLLNWLSMRRVDVVRKVLVGGKTQPRSANMANYLIGAESPDRDWYKQYNNVKYIVDNGQITVNSTGTTYNIKVYVGNNPPADGIIIQMSDRIRFGIMFFNDGYRFEDGTNSVRDGGYVSVDLGSTGTNLITQVENTDPSTWTPLAETLYEATRYFQATTSAYNGGTYSGKDPIQYRCQKNFVLILTDGESTKDQNIPGTKWSGTGLVSDSNGFNVKTYMDAIAANEGYTSQWDTALASGGSYYLEGVAYYAHTTDFRSSTVGKSDIPGKQNLTIYTVFAFDDSVTARNLLKMTSKYGGFEDKNNNDKPDQTIEWDKNGDGVPDTYFEAQQGELLESAIQSALNDILARVSSGTAASILSNSEGSGANILQAVFYPKKVFTSSEASWIGEMQNLWYYLDPYIGNSTVREDTDYTTTDPLPVPNPDHLLNLKNDYIVRFYFDGNQTQVDLSQDTNGDGLGEVVKGTGLSPDDVKSIWRAGKLLWKRDASTSPRTIYTQIAGSLTDFTSLDTSAASTLTNLQAANATEAAKIINFVKGVDQTGYRNRTVTIGANSGVWKLGDIVSSTPRLQSSVKLNTYNLSPPAGYEDTSYGNDNTRKGFIYTSNYQSRGMAYVGANDGMLHAFRLGLLDVTPSGDQKAKLSGQNLGTEEWAFIPKNVLPYLKYLADPNYNHLYYVDGTATVFDAAIGKPSGCTSDYWDCSKDYVAGTNWRTVLVGGMGLGGASKDTTDTTCTDKIATGTCVKTPITGLGFSSYFAIDVTNPAAPSLLWEFSPAGLGFATAGQATVKISARTGGNPDNKKNGRWFAVFGSGPTGPIDTATQRFLGKSDQPLKVFVVDLNATPPLVQNTNYWVIDKLADNTQIPNAFVASLANATIDTDRWNKSSPGYYQDDALYFGYVAANQYPLTTSTTWTTGGVLRLVTGEDPNPANWKLTKVIDGIGPITTGIARLQDRKYHNLWLYFGTGRYYFSQDDNSNGRRLYGVKEPCYKVTVTHADGSVTKDDIDDNNCSTKLSAANLTNQDSASNATVTNDGWFIDLDGEDTTNNFGAERVITDPVAMTNGAVFFTTFKPTSDVCSFGGNSYLWAVKYDTGLQAPCAALEGKALLQVSTGSFEEVNLSSAFDADCPPPKGPHPPPPPIDPPPPHGDPGYKYGRRTAAPMTGKPPADPPPIISKSNLKPVKRIIHVQEH